MAARHVVIGGGTGYIGSALTHALREDGHTVTIISRSWQKPSRGINQMTWDNLSRNGLPEDATDVINVAGQNVLDPLKRWTDNFKKEVWNSRVQTTKSLATAVSHSKVNFFATISGVAYYKPGEKEYTEDDKCEKYDFLSELTHAWEEAAELPKNSKCRKVTIRSGVVLGRTGGMINQLFLPFFLGLGGPLGSGKQYMPWIHIADTVNLFLWAMEEEKVKGILNGVAPEIITNKKFAQTFAKAMWRPAFMQTPEFVLNLIFSKERAKIMTEGQKVIPKRVLDYGYEYAYPTIESACEQFSILTYIEHPY